MILSSGPGGQILTAGGIMENSQLGGNLALNVLPVTDHEQIEAEAAAVQSMEVSLNLTGGFEFLFPINIPPSCE